MAVLRCEKCDTYWPEAALEECACCPPEWNKMFPCCYDKTTQRPADWEFDPATHLWTRADGKVWRLGMTDWGTVEEAKPDAAEDHNP